jgi:hypothetical protein
MFTFSPLIILAKSRSIWNNDRFEILSLVIELLNHVFICQINENDFSHEAELTETVSATCSSLYKFGKTFLLISDKIDA